MRAASAGEAAQTTEINRSNIRDTEETFGSIFTDIVELLYPPPNTAAQLAAELHCTVRNVELYLSGKQKWSGDAIAFIVAEIMRRHHMRNIKIVKRG